MEKYREKLESFLLSDTQVSTYRYADWSTLLSEANPLSTEFYVVAFFSVIQNYCYYSMAHDMQKC